MFATIDCDWPPVCNWVAEKEYSELSRKVSDIENGDIKIKNTFKRWDKNKHLMHIEHSGYFRYCREIVFANQENCDAERFCAISFSQGGLQTILKTQPEQIKGAVSTFEKNIKNIWGDQKVPIIFCYRMRIGIK